MLAHSVNQEVGAAVDQDTAPNLVRPIIIVRKTSQTRLDSADDNRHGISESFSYSVAIYDCRPVGALARLAAGRV